MALKMPTGIAVSGDDPTSEVPTSSPAGGGPFDVLCPSNQVLIGFDGTMDSDPDSAHPWLLSATGHCATVALSGTGPFNVTVTRSADDLPTRGLPSDQVLSPAICPPDTVIVGFSGRYGSYVDALSFDCAPLTVVGDATNGYTLTFDPVNNVTTVGPIGGNGGGAFGPVLCNPGEIAVGAQGHSGNWFDGFALSCAPVQLSGTKR
jgi:hypothetical protein